MKRFKKVYVLLIVLVLACVATALVSRWEEKKEEIRTSEEVILALAPAEVERLAWSYEEQSFAFSRDEEGAWLYEADEAFPVDESVIDGLLDIFESFGVAFIIESPGELAPYGLAEPLCSIELATAGESYTVTLGNYSQLDSQRYVSVGDGNVYLVSQDPLESFELELSDMILHDETLDYDRVEAITFAGAQDYGIFYQEDSGYSADPEDVYFTERGGETLPLEPYRVEDYLGQMSILSLTNYVSYDATDEELETYGLDDPELSVTVDYVLVQEGDDGEETEVPGSYTLHISRSAEERAKDAEPVDPEAEEEEEEDYTAYVRVGESSILYEISASQYENLMAAGYEDLRTRALFTADFAQVTQIDISLEGASYTLTTQPPETEEGEEADEEEVEGDEAETLWYYEGEELDIVNIQTCLEELAAESFTDSAPGGKEEISLTLYLENESFPQMALSLYRHDGSYCLAQRDGESVSLIPRDEVVELIEAVNRLVLN